MSFLQGGLPFLFLGKAIFIHATLTLNLSAGWTDCVLLHSSSLPPPPSPPPPFPPPPPFIPPPPPPPIDYDLSELVRAWKEYIKEKARNQAKQVSQQVLNYECPPREESYRIPDKTQCDK